MLGLYSSVAMVLGPSGNINHHDGVPAETQSLWEIGLVFCFEVFSDLTFLPPLLIMHRHRRHFELYIGVFQLATGFLYNFCNALNVQMFLTELQWRAVLTRTSQGLRAVRTGHAYQPPACCTYRRPRAACPGAPRTSLGRAIRPAEVPR